MTDLIPRLLDLHTRRPYHWLLDGSTRGATPDKCAHCAATWPCETVRIIEEET